MIGIWAALLPPTADSESIDAPAIAIWALQFTPRVALVEEGVLIEVGASARLFGGLQQLRARIESEAGYLGVRGLAWATTGTAALALARSGVADGLLGPTALVLDRLPLEAITAIARHQGTLHRLGMRTLGDVRNLPRGGIGRRFDKELLLALDQAYGLRSEAYHWCHAPDTFSARLEFHSRVEHATALMFGARRLLIQMAGWLAARHMGVTAFTLRWAHDAMRSKTAGTGGELTVRTAEPTQSVEHLSRLLAEHLAKVELLAPAGDIELLASEAIPVKQESKSLLPETIRSGEPTALVLERLQARLGKDRVLRPILKADHRAEAMHLWQDASEPVSRAEPPDHVLPLPPWVLPEPLRLAERDNRPIYQGKLQLLLGPDRVEGGWWQRVTTDGGASQCNVQRDYWIVLSDHAGLLWIFQTRLDKDATAWFLHGRFA
jgi:protein ImuB